MSNFNTIDLIVNDYYATIRLSRIEVRNAINPEMIREIQEALSLLVGDDKVRAVVLMGEGSVFCAGADLQWMKSSAANSYEQNLEESKLLHQFFQCIYQFRKPLIAMVHGAAMGGALGILAACDVVFCAEDTQMAFSEVKLGIIPATIAPYVLKKTGISRAMDVMLSARRFSGNEACLMGLVNKSVPGVELEQVTKDYITHFKHASPAAVEACKALLKALDDEGSSFEEKTDRTIEAIASAKASKEGQEGMQAFLEKRPPNWMI